MDKVKLPIPPLSLVSSCHQVVVSLHEPLRGALSGGFLDKLLPELRTMPRFDSAQVETIELVRGSTFIGRQRAQPGKWTMCFCAVRVRPGPTLSLPLLLLLCSSV